MTDTWLETLSTMPLITPVLRLVLVAERLDHRCVGVRKHPHLPMNCSSPSCELCGLERLHTFSKTWFCSSNVALSVSPGH